MAGLVIFTDDSGNESEKEFTVGTTSGEQYLRHIQPYRREVKEIQVNGCELDSLLAQFDNLPRWRGFRYGSDQIVTYRGDFAKFIYDNMDLRYEIP